LNFEITGTAIIRIISISLMSIIGCLALCVAVFLHDLQPIWTYSGIPPWLTRLSSVGTGFFVSANGDILTNRHVVAGCASLTISGDGIRALPVKILGYPHNRQIDLAMLQANITPPAMLSFSPDAWPFSYNARQSPAEIEAGLHALTAEQTGPATLIGFPGNQAQAAPSVYRVKWQHEVVLQNATYPNPTIIGMVMEGESGSPVLYPSGRVAGIMFAGIYDKTPKPGPNSNPLIHTPYGSKSNAGEMIPAAIAAAFAKSEGAALTNQTPPDPANAVVRIYCFQNN
jgi:hypothetical protein